MDQREQIIWLLDQIGYALRARKQKETGMDVKTLLIEELHELVCSSGDQGNIIKYRKELLASGKISAECDEAIESVLEAMADLECAAQDAVDTLEEESEED